MKQTSFSVHLFIFQFYSMFLLFYIYYFNLILYSVRNYYELISLPSGLLVSGDAIASFSPVYGQGMSVACLEAEQLQVRTYCFIFLNF